MVVTDIGSLVLEFFHTLVVGIVSWSAGRLDDVERDCVFELVFGVVVRLATDEWAEERVCDVLFVE